MTPFRDRNYWALVLGGSSGIGLASAQKLASMGMNILVVHRDRRGAMAKIEPEFEKIRASGVKLETFNANALTAEGREGILSGVADRLDGGKIRLVLHSIALGNLKLFAPEKKPSESSLDAFAGRLGIKAEDLRAQADGALDDGIDEVVELATPAVYDSELLAGEEDLQQTIYNMGTSLLFWVQDVFRRSMFADDARVLGLTSEGNDVAWRAYGPISAAKAALEAVARSIALEYAPHGIRCNILQPGVTETPALRLIPGNKHLKARARHRNPFGRLTEPTDVADVVAMMCLDESCWINGAIIRVDGGEHIAG